MIVLTSIAVAIFSGIWANEAVTNTLVIEGDILAKGDYFALPEANGQIISEDRLQLNFTSPVSLRWIKLSMSSRAARTPVLMGILRADEFNLGEVTVLPGNNWTLPDFDDVISLLFRHPFRIDQTSTTPIFKEDLIRIEIGYSGKEKSVSDPSETRLYAEVADADGMNSWCFSGCMQASGKMGYCRQYCSNAG